MTRRAWSMVAGGPPNRPKGTPALFPQRPVENVEQPVMPFDEVQASDWRFGGQVNEREAAIAPLGGQRAGAEVEGFDLVDDLVIRHRFIVTDRA